MAESVLIGDGDYGSRLVIRGQDGFERHIDFPDSTADMFLRWADDTHLELWREPSETGAIVPEALGPTHVALKTYVLPPDIKHWYNRAARNDEAVSIPVDRVSATFVERPNGEGKFCVLTLATKPDSAFDFAAVEITAGVNPQRNISRPAAGISTRFHLANTRSPDVQTMLTSATISDIPSYNRLPEGDIGTSVRGQILEQSAATLMEDLKRASISLDFSRDFFRQILRYEFPLSGVARTVSKFEECVGDADMD